MAPPGRYLRRCRGAAVWLAAAALAGGCATGPAAPSDTGHYVSGAGPLRDDWTDEYVSAARHPHSDLAALWQSVLWADGYLDRSQVNCRFDATTAAVTRTWQNNHGLAVDAIVGRDTFGTAGRRLTRSGGLVVYRGEDHRLPFRRAADGRYYVEDQGRYRALDQDRATLHVCG